MKAISKFLFVIAAVAVSALAQAEGVSQEDIDAGNHPYTESASNEG